MWEGKILYMTMFRIIPVVKHLEMYLSTVLPQHHEVLDHLFAQVVVYPVDLVLWEQGGQVGWQLLRALEVTTKRLFNNDPVPASVLQTQLVRTMSSKIMSTIHFTDCTGHLLAAHAVSFDVCADMVVDCGWQSQVEEPVGLSPTRQTWQMSIELVKRAAVVIPAAQVGVLSEESWETLTLFIWDLRETLKITLHITKS